MRKQRLKRINNKKKKHIIIGISTLIVMYLGISAFFMSHFHPGSKINGIDVSFKTIDSAEKKISSIVGEYSLQLEGRDGIKEKINGKEIGLAFNQKDKLKEFKNSQSSLKWITSFLNKSQLQIDKIVTLDKKMLKEKLDKTTFFNNKEVIEPKDVSFEYSGNKYKMILEVNGNKIKQDAVYKNIEDAILNGKKVLNLDKANCYENPKYTSKSKEAIETKKFLDKCTNLKVAYKFGENEEMVDGSIINEWIDIDSDLNVTFDENQISNYVYSLAIRYNTYEKTRDFTTSSGKVVKVSGGNYGWIINKSKEVKSLIEAIKKGEDITKEPIYSQTAVSRDSNDIGDTYVEINLTKQHMWFYKKGSLVTEGDVVTGNISRKFGTPSGTYRLNYKERKATLKGENYATPVDFWMPFNNNIGIHDAKWRKEFGKDIYKTQGSHGCVNSPPALAKTIFDNIVQGTPIVCYTE